MFATMAPALKANNATNAEGISCRASRVEVEMLCMVVNSKV